MVSEEKQGLSMKPEDGKYSFFQHSECEFFPCHETEKPEEFNCLFCYCPLYTIGSACGGNFRWLPDGTKDCSGCVVPHDRNGYSYVLSKVGQLSELTKSNR